MSFIMTFSCVYIMYFEDINFLFSSLIPYSPSHRSSSAFQVIFSNTIIHLFSKIIYIGLKRHLYVLKKVAAAKPDGLC